MRRRLPEATWLTRAAFITSFAATGFTLAYLISIYVDLPFAVPVRLISERPVIHSFKSPLLVMLPVLVQLSLGTFIAALVTLLLWRAKPASGDDGEDVRRMRVVAEGVALIGTVWIAVQAVAAARLVALWERGQGGFGDVYTVTLVTAAVLSVMIAARTMLAVAGRLGARPDDDPAVWRLRRLYFNRQNPALFVPARAGAGYTLNFGRPLAVIAMAGMLLFGFAVPYLVAFNILKGYWH